MPQLVIFYDVITIIYIFFLAMNPVFGILILVSIFALLTVRFILSCDAPAVSIPMSRVRYPTCEANGQESWVILGKYCSYCGTGC